MSSKKVGESQRDLEPKMSKVAIDDGAQQAQASTDHRGRSSSKSKKQQRVHKWTRSGSHHGDGKASVSRVSGKSGSESSHESRDDVTQSDTSESRGRDAAAASRAAKSPSNSWKESKVVVTPDVLFNTAKRLGQGLEGTVWKACLVGSVVSFAIKQVEIRQLTTKAKVGGKDFVLLAKEIANQRKCAEKSPLVLSVFAWSVEMNEGSLCLLSAMPLCKGSLARFIEVDGIRETYKPYVKLFTLQISEAVAVLHRLRVAHVDILPQNVFIVKSAEGYRVVVADFGCSLDFSDADQAKAASTSRVTELEMQVRDLYGIAGCYLAMQYGGNGYLKSRVLMENTLGRRYSKALKVESVAEGADKESKLNERRFVCSLLDSSARKEPLVPAKHVKLLPFFQGDNEAHPDWARDLLNLDENHRSAFAPAPSCRSLIDRLRDPKGGNLRLRGQDGGNKWSEQRDAIRADVDEARRANVENMLFTKEPKKCVCGRKKWLEVGVRKLNDERHYIARRCCVDGKKELDAVHLAELVETTEEADREPWCALINFYNNVDKHAVGKDVESELRKHKIAWTKIDARELQMEVDTVQSKLAKPSSSKQ